MTKQEVWKLQLDVNAWLAERGMPQIRVDGRYGEETRAAYQLMLAESETGGVGNPLPVPAAEKPWWLSVAMNGSLAGILSSLGGLVWWWMNKDQPDLLTAAVAGLISSTTAFYGTLNRKAPIDTTLVARIGDRDVRLNSGLCSPTLRASSDQRDDYAKLMDDQG